MAGSSVSMSAVGLRMCPRCDMASTPIAPWPLAILQIHPLLAGSREASRRRQKFEEAQEERQMHEDAAALLEAAAPGGGL